MDISLTKSIYPEKNLTGLKNAQKTVDGDAVKCGKDEKNEKEKIALKEACQGFEAIFIQSMMKSMRSTLPGDALFKDSHGMDIYTSMHDQYLAENIARGGNATGIGEYLYRQLQESL